MSCISHEILKKTAGICVVHLYGSAINVENLIELKKYNLYIVEDCAEALGSEINKKRVGYFGDIATFSFFGNKLITTGEGGMLVTKNKFFYDFINLIKNHGMSSNKRYWHEVVGTNARMTNIQAAIGLGQLENLKSVIEKKRAIHNLYFENLSPLKDKLLLWHEYSTIYSSYWLNVITIKGKNNVAKLIKEAENRNIDIRRSFYPMHSLPAFKKYSDPKFDYTNSRDIYDHLICLPSGLNLTKEQINVVCNLIKECIIK